MTRHPPILAALLLATAGLAAHAGDAPATLQAANLGATGRVHVFDGMTLASQPSAADLEIARRQGIRTDINLRHETEPAGFDERAEAARLGLQYVNLPWAGPDELTDAVFDEARRLLRDTPRPLLLHCGSGNRVGAVWIPWRVLDDGAGYEQALAEAREIGLASPAFEARARDYVERHQAGH